MSTTLAPGMKERLVRIVSEQDEANFGGREDVVDIEIVVVA